MLKNKNVSISRFFYFLRTKVTVNYNDSFYSVISIKHVFVIDFKAEAAIHKNHNLKYGNQDLVEVDCILVLFP